MRIFEVSKGLKRRKGSVTVLDVIYSNILLGPVAFLSDAPKEFSVSGIAEYVVVDQIHHDIGIPGDGQVCDAADQMLAVCFQWYQLD